MFRAVLCLPFVRHLGLVVLALALGLNAAAAQTYPSKTVRIIVPFAAGGLNDVVARLIQPYLEKALGQTVIVENKPGASGIIGTDAVAKGEPDGHTLLVVASSFTVVPATNPKIPYNAEKDLAPIAMLGTNPLLFVVSSKVVQAKTLAEFIAAARAEPGKFNYATPGAATQTHLVAALFSQKAGIKLQHIPYRGGAPAINALVAGDAHFTVISPLVSLPQIKAGNLRPLAAGSLKRDPQFPDLPTVAESGFPGFEAIQWVGLLTTAGTPKPIIERINGIVNEALKDPELVKKLALHGTSPAGGSAEQFQKTIATEIAEWTKVATEAGIRAK
jgi:tripartite-type tricarboxylate transporter receptor subunit TctC